MPTDSLWPEFGGFKTFSHHFNFPTLNTDFVPRVDIYQTEQHVIVKAELPGMTEKDTLDIRVTVESVIIRGELKRDQLYQDEQCCHQECFQGSFMRILSLPFPVYAEQAVASYDNGVLTITTPKKTDQDAQDVSLSVKLPRDSAKK